MLGHWLDSTTEVDQQHVLDVPPDTTLSGGTSIPATWWLWKQRTTLDRAGFLTALGTPRSRKALPMPCPLPFCDIDPDVDPHHHITTGYGGGTSFWWEWPPDLRRQHAIKRGWDADKAQRWAADPFAPEFRARWVDIDLDKLFTMDDLRAWLADWRSGHRHRPFFLPGTRLPTPEEYARDVELTQRAFGRRPRSAS